MEEEINKSQLMKALFIFGIILVSAGIYQIGNKVGIESAAKQDKIYMGEYCECLIPGEFVPINLTKKIKEIKK